MRKNFLKKILKSGALLMSLLFLLFIDQNILAADFPVLKGFNLTEDPSHIIAIAKNPGELSEAQKAVLEAKRLGANHIVINPRALMIGPFSNELIPVMRPGEANRDMTLRLVNFLKWVKLQKLTTQIRPIFYVVKDARTWGVYITEENGQKKIWWHGNIQPKNPNAWFDSYKTYEDIYLLIGKMAKVDFYTIGAELYSMTVGIEDMWKEHPHGFPKNWNMLLDYVRTKLPADTKIMYDANFTDDKPSNNSGLSASGGEFERWRYRLVDLRQTGPRNTENEAWFELKKFWTGLDAIGIDMYRSLAKNDEKFSNDYDELVDMLKVRSDLYAEQLDSTVLEIERALEVRKPLVFKVVGFKNADRGFVNPFSYDNPSLTVNPAHQAAAYQAFFESFFDRKYDWFKGVVFWDLGLNPKQRGPDDNGFTPIGKKETEEVIKRYFHED